MEWDTHNMQEQLLYVTDQKKQMKEFVEYCGMIRQSVYYDTLMQVIGEEPVPPRRLNKSLPLDLETICLKCLEKSPPKRYGTAAALASDLDAFINDLPITARPINPVAKGIRWARRNSYKALTLTCTWWSADADRH